MLQSSWKQNYALRDKNFCVGTHILYSSGALCTHVSLICMCQNSVADGQIHTTGNQKPLTLPRHAYRDND